MFYSIIVPVYNVEKYIKDCIDSIINQSFNDYELILVDDGSTDASGTICDEYAMAHSNVKVIHKGNGGSNSARKVGMSAACGDYICCVDGDDYVDSDWLKKIYDVVKNGDYDICCYGYCKEDNGVVYPIAFDRRIGEYTKEQIRDEIFPSLISNEQGKRFSPSLVLKVFKRELILPIQLDLSDAVVIGEDGCVCYSCIYKASKLYILDERLYYYRKNSNSLTNQRKKSYSWEEPILKASFLEKHIPDEMFAKQISRITVGATINVAASMFFNKKYKDAKKEILFNLNRAEYKKYLKDARYKGAVKFSLAAFCLRHNMVFILYLYAKLFK